MIAELHGLTKKRTQKDPEWTSATRESYWRFVREELSQIELREHPVTITEMDTDELAQLGPTDASILVLATRLGAVVLTEDRSLRDRCTAREIRVLDYEKVRELWKQSII